MATPLGFFLILSEIIRKNELSQQEVLYSITPLQSTTFQPVFA